MVKCDKCAGWWEEHRRQCPFCECERMRANKRTPPPLKLSQDEHMYNNYPSLIADYERAKAAKVPAAFTGQKPDTPEAAAARRQVEISKGIDVPNTPNG